MIGLDTNILARYYVDDKSDAESTRQHQAARRLIESGSPLMVSKTVILEFEWVLRGYYEFEKAEVLRVLRHLLSLPQFTVEDRATIEQTLSHAEAGVDLVDAMHYASYRECESMASFDDKKLARRAKRLGLRPLIIVPA